MMTTLWQSSYKDLDLCARLVCSAIHKVFREVSAWLILLILTAPSKR